MPVQYLKIDGIFVKEIATDEVSRVMVKSINEIGVDYAQGYHIHKPEPLTDI